MNNLIKVLCVVENDTDPAYALVNAELKTGEEPQSVEWLQATNILTLTASQNFVDVLAKEPEIQSVENEGEMTLIKPV